MIETPGPLVQAFFGVSNMCIIDAIYKAAGRRLVDVLGDVIEECMCALGVRPSRRILRLDDVRTIVKAYKPKTKVNGY